MNISRIRLKNWKNFRNADVMLKSKTYIIGPNASGKSNFLDVFRFLRDVAKTTGGLQKAVNERGGIKKLRCLEARTDPEVMIHIYIDEDDGETQWEYILAFKSEGKGQQRILISEEKVICNQKIILSRPNAQDNKDVTLRTQTHMEQILANAKFRVLADFFSSTTYLHLVPQLLKYSTEIGGKRLDDDPFGQGFLEKLSSTQQRTREAWLNKIQKSLSIAVPQFKELRFVKDEINGVPHLEARYEHWRPNAGWQREDQFSDGTLRLVALIWALLEKRHVLLLEEPELSLNDGIVRHIPEIIYKTLKGARNQKQVIISTHSQALLDNSLDAEAFIILEPTKNGTIARHPTKDEVDAIMLGLTPAEILLPKTRPSNIDRIAEV